MKKNLQIIIRLFVVCFLLFISNHNLVGQTTWTATWTGKTNFYWTNPENWNPQTVPNANTDVIIPAGLTTYPVCLTGCTCRNIYIAAGARLEDQHLLTYTKAFVDISINTNRYVRITPPLKETYSGDFFTKEQGGDWSNLTPAQYKPTDGKNGKNRVYPGATYQSIFSETSTQRGNYGETAVSEFVSGWANPKNALNTEYKPLQAIDVWVDTKEDGVATFHFPSGATTYNYYDQNGKKQSFGENTPRTAESGRFVYDNAYANGIYDIEYDRNNVAGDPAFALGNPAMAYMDVTEFLRLNGGSNISPYLYRHSEVSLGRGTETLLYYNKTTNTLYKVNSTNETSSTNIVDANDARNYIAPARAFRVVSIPTEPRLIGQYSCTYSYPAMQLNRRTYDHQGWWRWEWSNHSASIPASTESHTLTIRLKEGPSNQVILSNFAGRGDAVGTVTRTDENNGFITITNGTYVNYLGSDWHNSNNVFAYGAKSNTHTFTPTNIINNYTDGVQYTYYQPSDADVSATGYDYYTQYATNLNYDIIIDYTIADNGALSLSLRNGFAIYNQELKNGTKRTQVVKKDVFKDGERSIDKKNNTTRGNLVAWWVYNNMTATKNTKAEEDVFILPAALGNYSVYTRFENTENAPNGVDANRDENTNFHMTIRRYGNSYDQVTISGFYPGHDSYVMGTISNDGGTYKLTIPDGQLVKKNSATDNTQNYYLYGSLGIGYNNRRTNEAIRLNWNGSQWETPSTIAAQYHAQVSLGNGKQPDANNPGFYWYQYKNSVNILILNLYEATTEENAVGTPPPSQETTLKQVALRFTPDMFKANPTITSGASLAPRRQGQKDSVTSPIVNIRATGEGVSGNTLIVVDSTARNAFSMAEDAPLFDVADYNFCIATLAGEQIVGVNALKELDIVPLYIQGDVQSVTLHFDNIEALGDYVELYDALTEDSLRIMPGQCSIDLELFDGDEAGRFFLRKGVSNTPEKPEGPATEIETPNTETTLQAWSPMKGVAVIHTNDVPRDARLWVIDMSGRVVHNAPAQSLHTVRNLTTGVYVLRVGTPTEHRETKLTVQ